MGPQADIALIGLAVMGRNLILNMNGHGFNVVACNRAVSKVDDFLNNGAEGAKVPGARSYERVDEPRGEFIHANWTGAGGRVASGTYTL